MIAPERTLDSIAEDTGWQARIADCTPEEAARMRRGATLLAKAVADGQEVYGVTRGFGPLVAFPAAESAHEQGAGLIAHLGTAQGDPLPPDVCRAVVWLRLNGIRQGYSATSPEFWAQLADLWNRGFTPAIPRDGTVSASGDLQPLASAALAFAGIGEAWVRGDDGSWTLRPAAEVLRGLGAEPLEWEAREALSFVNGSSVSLAVTIANHRAVRRILHAVAALSGRIATLLGSNPQAYHPAVGEVRGQRGQIAAAGLIRAHIPDGARRDERRPLQEPYSLRCAPQVLGAVLDQLDFSEQILVREASGCTDNPVFRDGEILHGGNFHAMPVGLCSDQTALALHQVAFLADRQLALVCAPETNGGLPPMLTPRPGAGSGLAGVQLSATSFTSRIRQLASPASLTALPCNNGNQDHVPMALNGANALSEAVEQAWLVVGSLAVGAAQLAALTPGSGEGEPWDALAGVCPPLEHDRPLAAEVRAARDVMAEAADRWCAAARPAAPDPAGGGPREASDVVLP